MPQAGPAETRASATTSTSGPDAQPDASLSGFFDAVGGGPLHPAAAQALALSFDPGPHGVWADPRALHGRGRHAHRLADGARDAVAAVLGVRPDEVRFTTSGDTARRAAVVGLAAARHRAGPRVVTSAVEQAAVLDAAAEGEAVIVGVDERGRLDTDAFSTAVLGGAACAAVQLANQEVGTVQDVAALAAICVDARIPLAVDLAAAPGRLPIADVPGDVLAADAGAWGGPAVGVLVVRTGTRWTAPPGLVEAAVPLQVAAAAALVAAEDERATLTPRWRDWTEQVRDAFAAVPDTAVAGDPDPGGRTPGLLAASFLYVDGEDLVGRLDVAGLAVASGSACTSEDRAPSHVLAAMGVLTQGNLRVSMGRWTTEADVQALMAAVPPAVAAIRDRAGMSGR